MRARHRIVLGLVLLGLIAAGTMLGLAPLVRRLAVAQIHALTERPVAIETVALNLLTGRLTVRGLRVTERDGTTAFVDIERLHAQIRLPALALGHVHLRELTVDGSRIRVVRLPGGTFNISDLLDRPGTRTRPLDVTVDRFAVNGGAITLEDRALPEPRTWASDQITIVAHDLSTRRGDGRAVGHSMTAGAPLSMEIRELRLYPIHLIARVSTEGVDLSPLRLYFPPEARTVLTRGRASCDVTVALDAREGVRVDGTARLEDVALGHPEGGAPLALVPSLGAQVTGFGARAGALRLGRLGVEGTMSVQDPSAARRGRYVVSRVQASVSDLTWPATTPGRLDVVTGIPGGGTLTLTGTLRAPPEASQLRLRVADADLAPWSPLLPLALRVSGRAQADLHVDEPLAPGVPTRVRGVVAVQQLAVADAHRELLAVQRVEAQDLELHWPARLVVTRAVVRGPRGTIERDRAGVVVAPDLGAASPHAGAGPARHVSGPTPGLEIRDVVIQDGQLRWRDAAMVPAADLTVSGIEARIANAAWPPRGPLGVRAALRPPGGGQLRLDGRVGIAPASVDLRLSSRNAELAPYQPYVPTTARVGGAVDLDLAVTWPAESEQSARVRGSATLSRLDVRDGERTVARVERATARRVELDWPGRLGIGDLALTRPWLLVERDAQGGLPLRVLLTPAADRGPSARRTDHEAPDSARLAVSVARLSIDGGGARLVDHAVTPAFAVDVDSASVRVDHLSTAGAGPARVEARGRVGASAELVVRGTVAAFGGPLRVDVTGELHEFSVPRANPYLLRQVGWQTREGRLTTALRCHVEGDALSAHTEVRVSRLQLVRAGGHDEAQARIGLPLGLVSTLLKDRRGDIVLSLPVGGRLNDPRFDIRDVFWSAIRTVAVNTITLPVSWIGRVHFTPDSRIERIQVDPVTFQPGTASLTPEGDGQVGRLAAFLDRLPQTRLKLTPVVTDTDAAALRSRALDATLDDLERRAGVSRGDAARRLFAERFPGHPVPGPLEATLSALREQTALPGDALAELATQRLQALRASSKRAGIDADRLLEMRAGETASGEGRVEVDVGEPDTGRRSPVRDVLRRLRAPFTGEDRRP